MLIVEPKGEPSKVRDVVAIAAKLVADGRRDDAEQALLNADLADFEVIEALITLYLGDKRDRADQALSFLLDVRSKFADDPRYYWQLAIVYTRQRKRPEAIEAANRYVALCREKAQDKIAIAGSLVSLGFTHFWFDDLVAAVESTEAALDLLDGTKDKMVYICKSNLAYYYAQLRVNREKALLYAQESLDHTGGAANALDTSGFVRMRFFENDLRELTKARAEFIRAGEVEPGLAAAYRHLAEVDALIKRAKLPPQAIGP
jgi:tetratricopeptide (TPR) repeat protein